MARQHGYKGQVKMDPTGGTTMATVASVNAWTMDAVRDLQDVTAFGDGNKVYVQGLPDRKGTLSAWWDTADVTLFAAAEGDIPVFLHLIPSTLTSTFLWKGHAYLSMSINVPASGAISTTGSWSASDTWVREP